jgi:hypothetical protein
MRCDDSTYDSSGLFEFGLTTSLGLLGEQVAEDREVVAQHRLGHRGIVLLLEEKKTKKRTR